MKYFRGQSGEFFMKIDPSEKQQHILSSPNVNPVGGNTTDSDFAKVLGDTVQKSSGAQTQSSGSVQPSMAPSMVMSIGHAQGDLESATAHDLLNALEKYQHLLGDSKTDLKTVAPAVDDMKSLAKKAQPILEKMQDGHPVKTVAQETLVEMSKEIERFRAGYYVDE